MSKYSLSDLGWQTWFEQQVTNDELENHIVARVCTHHGSHILCLTQVGEISVPSALLDSSNNVANEGRSNAGSIAIGDWLLLSKDDHRLIRNLDRKTLISRKAAGETVKPQLIAANVDTCFIVSSCNLDFNLSRFERYLALVIESGATPIIVLTKADLHDDPASLRKAAEQLSPGLLVETLDARDPNETSVLDYWCRTGQTIAMLGSSGVGKSTLANAMTGLELSTSTIREDDDKGRHTTTHRSMHRVKTGGWLVDNPGMRELQLADCESGVAELFEDVVAYADQCRFRNCKHEVDEGCAIQAAIESGELDARRAKNYFKLKSEQARNSASLAERREKDRKTGRYYKSVIEEKRRRRER